MGERKPIDELPFRDISVEATLLRLMSERNETLDDVLWVTPGPYRAADFERGIMRTRRHVYTIVKDCWQDDAYVCKVFVSNVEDGHG